MSRTLIFSVVSAALLLPGAASAENKPHQLVRKAAPTRTAQQVHPQVHARIQQHIQRTLPTKSVQQRVLRTTPHTAQTHVVKSNPTNPTSHPRGTTASQPVHSADPAAAAVANKQNNFVHANAATLHPVRAVATAGHLRGRTPLPGNIHPRLALLKAPLAQIHPRFRPFVQRHWRSAFFWVTVAGIGYVTVPEAYYNWFYTYVNLPDPDYARALNVLAWAAAQEEAVDEYRAYPMPAGASYRYRVAIPPPAELATPIQASAPPSNACQLTAFVERKWNRPVSWVLIPQIGNVSVPDDIYDRFYGFVSTNPPDYNSACAMLAQGVANDTVAQADPE